MAIVLRYVFDGSTHEHYLGYTHAQNLTATGLSTYILNMLSELELDIDNCISQCYDGASVMSSACSGVSAKIKEKNSKAVYIHCCSQCLNLALVDTVKVVPSAEDFFILLEKL